MLPALTPTNPNTSGLFERDMIAIAEPFMRRAPISTRDGANFNAIMGRVKPWLSLGVDAMHINLHKTFSTPHGGGGPGAGRWCFPSDWRVRAIAAGRGYDHHAR